MRKEAFEADWQKQSRVEKARASFGRNFSGHDAAMAEAWDAGFDCRDDMAADHTEWDPADGRPNPHRQKESTDD